MSSITTGDWGSPSLPVGPQTSIDGFSLSEIRDTLTAMPADTAVEQAIKSVLRRWDSAPETIDPLDELRAVLESIRALPRGDARIRAMNTYVRNLGEPTALATLLDMMRISAERSGTRGEELTSMSRDARRHCVYGWAGQTLLLASDEESTAGTLQAENGVGELIGGPPPSVWGLTLHIWQPNPNAKGFPTGGRIDADLVVEPPHSHPFDFSSMVSVGVMRQSIYEQRAQEEAVSDSGEAGLPGRYDGMSLEHVDGVWPEHTYRSSCALTTLETGIELLPGDSYHLPCNMIHDVEFDAGAARNTPAITLFLASEIIVKPHVYMVPEMADLHAEHPELKDAGRPLPISAWRAKLEAVAAYLRGEQSTLQLDEIVDCRDDYGFFHA